MTIRRLLASTVLVLIPAVTACADPAPAWGAPSIILDMGTYDLTVTPLGVDGSGQYGYQWDVTFNGTGLDGDPNTPPMVDKFAVYDLGAPPEGGPNGPGQKWIDISTDPTGWTGTGDGDNAVAEWHTTTNELQDADGFRKVTFTAKFKAELLTPEVTVIHIRNVEYGGEDSVWVTNTPELPPSLLSMLGFGGLAFFRRLRRRK